MFSPIMAASSQRYLLSRVNSGITVGHGGGILPLKLHEAVDAAQLLVQLRILTHYQAGFLIVSGAEAYSPASSTCRSSASEICSGRKRRMA